MAGLLSFHCSYSDSSNKVGGGQVSCVLPAFGKERSEQQGDGTEGVFFCKKILKK